MVAVQLRARQYGQGAGCGAQVRKSLDWERMDSGDLQNGVQWQPQVLVQKNVYDDERPHLDVI